MTLRAALLIAILATMPTQVIAQPHPSSLQYLDARSVTFLDRPTGVDFQDAFPNTTAYVPSEGLVVLDCNVTNDGLPLCVVDKSTMADVRLANIALQASGKFRVAPATVDGAPTAGRRIRIPISFKND